MFSSGSLVSEEVEYDVPRFVTDELGSKAKEDVITLYRKESTNWLSRLRISLIEAQAENHGQQ